MPLQDPVLLKLTKLGFGKVARVEQDAFFDHTAYYAQHGAALAKKAFTKNEAKRLKAQIASLRSLRSATLANPLIRVPQILAHGDLQLGGHFVLLEHMNLSPLHEGSAHNAVKRLGQGLADLHTAPQPPGQVPAWARPAFGFSVDTYDEDDDVPLSNAWKRSFVDFFIDQRLQPEIARVEDRLTHAFGVKADEVLEFRRLSDSLCKYAAELLAPLSEPPSLLHGKFGASPSVAVLQNEDSPENGDSTSTIQLALLNPSSSYGLPELDLAHVMMDKSFGEYTNTFFEGYHSRRPKPSDYEERLQLFSIHLRLRRLASQRSTPRISEEWPQVVEYVSKVIPV